MKATINGIEYEGTVDEIIVLTRRLKEMKSHQKSETPVKIGRPKGCLDKTKRKSKELIQNIAPELSKQHSKYEKTKKVVPYKMVESWAGTNAINEVRK